MFLHTVPTNNFFPIKCMCVYTYVIVESHALNMKKLVNWNNTWELLVRYLILIPSIKVFEDFDGLSLVFYILHPYTLNIRHCLTLNAHELIFNVLYKACSVRIHAAYNFCGSFPTLQYRADNYPYFFATWNF